MKVVIPSYRRPEMCRDKTLRLLLSRGIDPGDVTVFVAHEAERDDYDRVLADSGVNLEISAPGLGPSRNYIAERYDAGTHVLHCDDDLDDLLELAGDRLVPLTDVAGFAEEAFATAERLELRLWGVYPVPNAFFMRPTSTTGLRLIAGPFYGTVASPGKPEAHIALTLGGEKEDHERTLRYFCADGGVLRVNRVAVKTRWYKNPGGLQGSRSAASEEAAVAALLGGWPSLLRRRKGRKSGYPELRFVHGA